MSLCIDQDVIKKHAWHLKVMGAYVQSPIPAIVGLDENTVIGSNDAAALYPTSIIYSNIGFDTIRNRVYDTGVVQRIVRLITQAHAMKADDPNAIQSAVFGFTGALDSTLKGYFRTKSVQNKKEAREFTLEYYPELLRRVLNYEGDLKDIFEPKDDETYFLLKSCLYPIIEAVSWLSPQNRGYNQMLVDYVFFNDKFLENPKQIYVFTDINSTKTQFKILEFQEGIDMFKKHIINPYGILFDRHEDNLAYDVELLMDALSKRRIFKDQMLVLKSIHTKWNSVVDRIEPILMNLDDSRKLTPEQGDDILDIIQDSQAREKRIKSLCSIEFKRTGNMDQLHDFINLRITQLNTVQQGIKVAANSAYGIFGLITWPFASPLIGNAITNAGKIYGIKLFQAVTVNTLNDLEKIQEV